jgi:hypothetical protein
MESTKILGYLYNTEAEAIEARQIAATYYGLPKTPDSTTIYFVDYAQSGEYYYIAWCEGCTEALGEPIEFELNLDEPNNELYPPSN